jgi:carboxynorspermidine decarboxylase
METRAGDPGAFAQFDLQRVDSPSFVVDAARLRENWRSWPMSATGRGSSCCSALKAFSMWSTAPIIGEYLDGVCTSGLWEARLASEFYDGEIATYCAAYKPEDLDEILRLSDHVIFNSPQQIIRCSAIIEAARARGESFDIGLRINPLHPEGEVPRYDPCAPHSRLGFPIDQLTEEHIEGCRRPAYAHAVRAGFRAAGPDLGRRCLTISSRSLVSSSGSIWAADTTSPAAITSAMSWFSSCSI